MRDWVVPAVLYLLGIGFFRVLGGLDAAGEALRRWGAASAARRRATSSS